MRPRQHTHVVVVAVAALALLALAIALAAHAGHAAHAAHAAHGTHAAHAAHVPARPTLRLVLHVPDGTPTKGAHSELAASSRVRDMHVDAAGLWPGEQRAGRGRRT